MAIKQTSHVREILFVRETPTAPWAIHQKRIFITTGAAFPIADAYGEAEALSLDDVGDVLGAVVVDLTAQLAAMTAERDSLAAQLAAMTAEPVQESTNGAE